MKSCIGILNKIMNEEDIQKIKKLISTGDYADAHDFLSNISEESQNNLDYLYYSAHVSRKLEKLEQAELYCKRAFKIDKNSSDINFEIGLIYQILGKHRLAIENFQRALKNIPDDSPWIVTVDTLNSLALTYKKAGDFGGGLKYYNLALETLAQVIYEHIKIHQLQEVDVQYANDNQEGWMRLAIEIATKNAAKDGKKNVLFPTGETASKLLKENAFFGRALHDEDETRYILPSYFSAFSKALKADILYSRIINNIGTLFAEKGEISEARKCYLESIEFTPHGIKYDDPFIALESLQNE